MNLSTSIANPQKPVSSEPSILCNSQQFDICIADTPKLREEVFKIRYRVYCQELGYEPLSKFSDKLERDAYDFRSIHLLLKYKPENRYIVCVRLVLSSDSFQSQFPFEKVCSRHFFDFNKNPRSHCGEVSRLAVLRNFRHWDQKNSYGDFNKRRLSMIPLTLYLAIGSIVVDLKLKYVVSFMEPRLCRQLKLCGLTFNPCGPIIEFKGRRGPFILNTSEMYPHICQDVYLYNLFKKIQANIRMNDYTNTLDE